MEKIEFENRLLEAIKKDDLQSFSLLMPTNADLNLCYGRFPILSLLYLYSSFKILSKFEKILMPIRNFRVVEEPMHIYKTFKSRAGKSIRFFTGETIVYPVLMLAILNEKTILEKRYGALYKNEEIKQVLEKIYKVRHESELQIAGESIVLPPRKISLGQTLLFALVCLTCCLSIAFSGVAIAFISNKVGTGSFENPIKITTSQEFASLLKDGKRVYSLQTDIEINGSDFANKDFSGTILGNGFTVKVNGEITNSMMKNLSGRVENLIIELVDNEIKITQNFGIFAENSSGIIEKCKIFGKFNGEFDSDEEVFAGGFVSKNTGEIIDSEVSLSGSLKNNKESNAYYCGFAGVNDGVISNSVANAGVIVADTVDLAGIACENNGSILNAQNKTTLSQVSSKEWHPNIGGISVVNNGLISNSKNYAELNAESKTENDTDNLYYVFVGGIACENYGEISGGRNFGKIVGKGKISSIVVGGIVSQNVESDKSQGQIKSSLSKSDIEVFSESGQVCVGGVSGLNASVVSGSGFIGNIDANSNSEIEKDVFTNNLDKKVAIYAGGVVGISQYSKIENSYADVNYFSGGAPVNQTEEGEILKLYAGIVGNIGIYAYREELVAQAFVTDGLTNIKNNYYVEKENIKEKAYGVYALTLYGSYKSGVLVEVNDTLLEGLQNVIPNIMTALNKAPSLADIPLEVVYE